MEEEHQQTQFEVEKITGKAVIEGNLCYQVKWRGTGEDPEECTWEPVENLQSVAWMIEDFEKAIQESTSRTCKFTHDDDDDVLVEGEPDIEYLGEQ